MSNRCFALHGVRRGLSLNIHPTYSRSFRGDSKFQMDYSSKTNDNPEFRTFGTRSKCTIPCGGVGILPRERVPTYEIKTACQSCTHCFQFSAGGGGTSKIDDKEQCEAIGCCEWEAGKLYGGYCNAAKTGLCTAESTHQGGASSRVDGDTELTPQSGISCKVVC